MKGKKVRMKSLKEEHAERAIVAGVRKDPRRAKENGWNFNRVDIADPTESTRRTPESQCGRVKEHGAWISDTQEPTQAIGGDKTVERGTGS